MMNIDHLKEFVVLTETGNFMEAAERLDSTQSTLSKHLKSIELELGVQLFNRTTRKVELNKYGELLLPYARQIVELHEKYSEIIQNTLASDRETLNLGSIPALAEYNITDVLVKFKRDRPQSIINVIQGGSSFLKEMLRQKKCEVAFVRYVEDMDDDITKIPYVIDSMVAVVPLKHPFATRKNIPLKMLENEDFVLSEPQTMLHKLSVKACEQSGFHPRIAHTDDKHENVIDFVIKGFGVALMMKRIAQYVAGPKTAIVDITPQVTTQINLCHLKDIRLSHAARYFIKCARS